MKRFCLVLLSLGLVMAFSASAFAVDVKFSGTYYVGGMYLDKNQVMDKKNYVATTAGSGMPIGDNAFFYQSLRLKTEFVVSPGLSLITRATIMERAWGATRTAPGSVSAFDTSTLGLPGGAESAGTNAENQNIAFDWAYIHWVTPIGLFDIGYQLDGPWGTKFGDSDYANPRIIYYLPVGSQWLFAAAAVKLGEGTITGAGASSTSDVSTGIVDSDGDKYAVGFVFMPKPGTELGLLGGFWRYGTLKATANTLSAVNSINLVAPAQISYYAVVPYFKAKIGPVTAEGEFWWVNGDIKYENNLKYLGLYDHVPIDNNMQAYLDVTVDLMPVYFGGMICWVRGDDPNTKERVEGGIVGTGKNLEPTLILFSWERYKWNGGLNGNPYGTTSLGANAYTSTSYQMSNGWMFQGRVGVKPTPKLDVQAKLTYAIVDKKPQGVANSNPADPTTNQATGVAFVGDTYGTELDLTASYKITNNLTYVLGGGYLWTGNYFKGTDPSANVSDDYLLINKLILTF